MPVEALVPTISGSPPEAQALEEKCKASVALVPTISGSPQIETFINHQVQHVLDSTLVPTISGSPQVMAKSLENGGYGIEYVCDE